MNAERKRSHHQIMGEAKIAPYLQQDVDLINHLEGKKPTKDLVIYIHVPYCLKICSFCSLRRTLNQPISNYGELLIKEMKQYSKLDYFKEAKVGSVYFGGGTPTSLPPETLSTILLEIQKQFKISEDCELSLETTLTELDENMLKALSAAGANRLSIGVQTFKDSMRKIFNRRGDGAFAIQRIEQAKKYIDNINIDIIYNYPDQTEEDVRRDVRLAHELDCYGFSMYSLMNMKKNPQLEGDRSKEKALFFALVDEGLSRGYHFFETTKMVSNDRYRYIDLRLSGSDTLPLGAGAGGELAQLATMNPPDVSIYSSLVEQLSSRKGILKNPAYEILERYKGHFQRCSIPLSILETYPKAKVLVEDYLKSGLLSHKEDHFAYTKEGVYWGNNISSSLLEVIAEYYK